MTQRLIISCTPRSGSAWLAERLQECGLDVGHEKEGKDGIVSYMAHLDMATQSDKLQDTSGLRVHLIRDPADCIASMVARGMPSQSTVDFLNQDRKMNAVEFWGNWNYRIHVWANVTVSLERLIIGNPQTWGKIGALFPDRPKLNTYSKRINESGLMTLARESYEEWT